MTWLWAAALLAAAPPVELDLPRDCPGIRPQEVRDVVAVELRLSAPADPRALVTRATVTCAAPRVTVRVEDPISRKQLERSYDFSTVPPLAASRSLALAIVELVVVSWSELVTNPRPVVEPAATVPPPEQADAARAVAVAHARRSRLLAEGTFEALAGGLLLWGGGLRWSWERHPVLGLELDLRVEHGARSLAQGLVSADRATAGLAAHARLEVGVVTLRAVAGLRGGAVRLSGEAAQPGSTRASSGVGPWLGLTLGAAAAFALGPVSLELALHAGLPLVGVVGVVDGAPAVAVNGASFGAHVGLGFFP